MKPTLFLFVGYPGAGKTSVAQLIESRTHAVHLWADHVRKQMFEQPCHSRNESKQLYDYLNSQASELLAAGTSVIFDTNFNFYDDRQLLRKIASDNAANTVLIWVNTPIDLSRTRAVHESDHDDKRVYGNMTATDFERIAGNFQPPDASESAVAIDGTKLIAGDVYAQLKI